MLAGSGGGEAFTNFLEKDLIPYVDAHYATAPHRTLVGHSLGGLMAINTLLKHSSVFSAYAALDPSMSYDREKQLKQVNVLLSAKHLSGKTLFLGIANTMNPEMDTVQVKSDNSSITNHIRSIFKLKDFLTSDPDTHLRWTYGLSGATTGSADESDGIYVSAAKESG